MLPPGTDFSYELRLGDAQPITELVPGGAHGGQVALPERQRPGGLSVTPQTGVESIREGPVGSPVRVAQQAHHLLHHLRLQHVVGQQRLVHLAGRQLPDLQEVKRATGQRLEVNTDN